MLSASTFVNKRLLAVLLLGFTSGLPLMLTSSTLQAWFTQSGISIMTIGSLSLLGIPYILKFLWAPLMDYYGFPKLGKRKGWILFTQLGLVLTLLVLANMDPTKQAATMGLIALAIAFFSASQDVSITAYQTDILHPEERGLGVSYYIFTYRLAMLIAGGAALISADYIGWKATYEGMAGVMLVCMLFTYYMPPVQEYAQTEANNSLLNTISASLRDFLQRDQVLCILAFILFYKFGDALAQMLLTNFLLSGGLGFTLTEVGLAYKAVGFIATLLGAFIGGVFLTRWNIYTALLYFGLAQAFSNLMFAALAMIGKHFFFMMLTIFIESFCAGLSTAALLAFIMSLCNHRYTATQFALLSAVASLARVLLGPLAAWMVATCGWIQFYIWTFVLCFPGIIFLMLLKNKVLTHAPVALDQ